MTLGFLPLPATFIGSISKTPAFKVIKFPKSHKVISIIRVDAEKKDIWIFLIFNAKKNLIFD